MTNPANYKTFQGLIKALQKRRDKPNDFKNAYFFHNAKWVLQNFWGFTEKEACIFMLQFESHIPAYTA